MPARRDPGTAKGFESQHGSRASLDRPMVLLDKVVEIFGLANLDVHFTIIIDGFECDGLQSRPNGRVAESRRCCRPCRRPGKDTAIRP